ncbi:MAG: hypothetical protein KAH84_04290 [Thiomargarita sp.]|nr:hypothetical protein [Thiomargarita sp.]
MTNNKPVELCLEQICQLGCRAVNNIIEQLEQQQFIDIIKHLNEKQRQILLQELNSIMAVYSETNSCEVKFER